MRKVLFIALLVSSVSRSQQIITTIAGTGTAGYSGDGGAAVSAQLNNAYGTAFDKQGNLYICDALNNRIRKVDLNGVITTFAGTGSPGYSGDGGPAAAAKLNRPSDIAIDTGSGDIYIADELNFLIRKVNAAGIITTYAGTGVSGYTGDGGPATSAQLTRPNTISINKKKELYIGLYLDNVIRKVDTLGIITTYAGNGYQGYSGDGGQAIAASFNNPCKVAFDNNGNTYICDEYNQRVRKVDSSGVITTVAGSGGVGSSGNGGLATSAAMNYPEYIAIDASGNLFIGDKLNNMVRKVNTSGIISDAVGTGVQGYSGDGGPPTSAALNYPEAITFDFSGNMYVSDWGNSVIRKITAPCMGPAVTINGNVSICSGNSTLLTISGTATSYTWSANAGGVHTNTVSLSPGTTTSYTLLSSYSLCPTTNTTVITISVTPIPSLSITGNSNICAGASTTLSGSGATSYTWNLGVASVSSQTVTVSPNSPATYTLTGANGNCVSTATIAIDVSTPMITASSQTMCIGGSATLTATGGSSYTWSPAPQFSNSNGSVVLVNPGQTTTYTITGQTSSGCVGSTTVALTIDSCNNAINQLAEVNRIRLYPNPTRGDILIELECGLGHAIFQVINIAGQKVIEGELDSPKNQLDLSQLQNGVYYIRIKQREKITTTRIILFH